MAIRFLKGRATPWQVYWNNPVTGKRETQTFLSKEEAEKFDSLTKHRIKFEPEFFQVTEESAQENSVIGSCTLDEVYLEYLKQKQFDKKSFQWQMDSMKLALRQLGTVPIVEITTVQLVKLRDDLAQTGIKNVTLRKRMSVLHTVLRWAQNHGYCDIVPAFPPMPNGQYKKFVPPSPDELTAMLRVAPPHITRVIILGAQLGVRVGPCELMQLTWQDVDLVRGILRVHGSKKNLNSPWREVPIRQNLLPIFKEWCAEDLASGNQYLVHYDGKPVANVKHAWQATLRKAGITRHIRPYDLRHAFGTEMVAAGVDIGTVANLMGHSTPAMLLKHYQYVMDKQKKSAVESLPTLEYVNNMCTKTSGVGECANM